MKKIIALILVLVIATLCACGNQETPTKKKKKKIVYIERESTSSVDDSENYEDDEAEEDFSDEEDSDYEDDSFDEDDYYYEDEEDYDSYGDSDDIEDDSDKEDSKEDEDSADNEEAKDDESSDNNSENTSDEASKEEQNNKGSEQDKITTQTIEKTVTTKKVTSQNIGKNYYIFKPKVEHPSVAELDAYYEMIATDKRGRSLAVEDMVVECSDKRVKLEGNMLTIPYSVRCSGEKLTLTMYNKKFPNRTGSFTFDFDVQFTENPTFLDEFDTLDTNVWKDHWYEGTMPIEELYCESGELVMYATEDSKAIELSTTGTFRQAYGSFSARIKMPLTGVSNVAFWLCTEPGIKYIKNIQRPTQSGGEIDIVEYFSSWGDHRTSCTVHYNGWSTYHVGEGKEPQVKQTLRNEYHIYSCVWTSTAIYFYLDEDLIWTYTGDGVAPNSGAMQLLLQHSTNREMTKDGWAGKDYDPADYPNESRWDYVKVYGLESE